MDTLQARHGLDTNKDGEVSEDEAKFFLGDKESFDIESFKDSGFSLIKPYLDLEKVAPPVAEDDERAVPPTQELHPPDHPMMTPPPKEVDPEKPDYPMNMHPPLTEEDKYDEKEREDETRTRTLATMRSPGSLRRRRSPSPSMTN